MLILIRIPDPILTGDPQARMPATQAAHQTDSEEHTHCAVHGTSGYGRVVFRANAQSLVGSRWASLSHFVPIPEVLGTFPALCHNAATRAPQPHAIAAHTMSQAHRSATPGSQRSAQPGGGTGTGVISAAVVFLLHFSFITVARRFAVRQLDGKGRVNCWCTDDFLHNRVNEACTISGRIRMGALQDLLDIIRMTHEVHP